MIYRGLLTAAAALVGLAAAQVETDCNPMKKDCPPDPAFGTDHMFHFNSTPNGDLWETVAGTVPYDEKNGAAFTINKQGDSPTLRTKFYFFFGRTEIWVKAAPGKGIVSSMMWLSDVLDEVDWEFLGSNATTATSNYFGKGLQDFHNGEFHPMKSVQDDFHNYTTVWTAEKIDWYIDGASVRTLHAKDANNTRNYPQTPMRLSVGIWAGGDPSLPEGTRQWAGGDTDYAAGPYTMYMKKAQVTDFSSGKEYTYGDRSGSWESINVAAGNSTAFEDLNKQPEKSTAEKWEALPSTAKVGVYAGGGAVAAALFSVLIWYYLRQRRIGARESKLAEERAEAEKREKASLEERGIDPDGFAEHGQEYSSRGMRSDGMADSDSYNVPTSSAGPLDGKSWGGAAGAAGAAGVGAAGAGMGGAAAMYQSKDRMRGDPQNPRMGNYGAASPAPSSQQGFDFGAPPVAGAGMAHQNRTPSPGMARSQSPMIRTQSPAMPMQNQMRNGSPGPQQGYGAPPQRMQTPASPMGPARTYTGGSIQAPMGPAQSYTGSSQQSSRSPPRTYNNSPQSAMSPPRNYDGGGQPYRGPPSQGGGYHNQGGYY